MFEENLKKSYKVSETAGPMDMKMRRSKSLKAL